MPDYYGLLEVPRTASLETIKRAYRTKALEAHPDRGGTTMKMQELSHAYAVLSDPQKRKDYDKLGRDEPATGDVFASFMSLLSWLGAGAVVGFATFCWRTALVPAAAATFLSLTRGNDRHHASSELRPIAAACITGFTLGWLVPATMSAAFSGIANLLRGGVF